MARGLLLVAVLGLVLAACAPADVEIGVDGPPSPDVRETNGSPPEEDRDVTEPPETPEEIAGSLGGDPLLEGGCAWLETGDGPYEVFWPSGYEVVFDPLRLVDPEGEVIAREGDRVRVRGRVALEYSSICMVGTIFEAAEVDTP